MSDLAVSSIPAAVRLEITLIALIFFTALGGVAYYVVSRMQNVARTLERLVEGLNQLVEIRQDEARIAQDERELRSLAAANTASTTVAFAWTETYPADPETNEVGIGVFGVRNVGNETVFALGLTRSVDVGPPQSPKHQVIGVFDTVELSLVLAPDDPPLDLTEVTLWYRDMAGRHWTRRYGDHRAHRFEPVEAPEPESTLEPESAPEPEAPTEPEPAPVQKADSP